LTKKVTRQDRLKTLPGGAILCEDQRWGRCDIKAITLLPNILAKQKASQVGASEAILVKDDIVTEGTCTAVLRVKNGQLQIHPAGPELLPSITAKVIREIAEEMKIPWLEKKFTQQELLQSDELMVAGTISQIQAVTQVDDRTIGSGQPGPITQRLFDGYLARLLG